MGKLSPSLENTINNYGYMYVRGTPVLVPGISGICDDETQPTLPNQGHQGVLYPDSWESPNLRVIPRCHPARKYGLINLMIRAYENH